MVSSYVITSTIQKSRSDCQNVLVVKVFLKKLSTRDIRVAVIMEKQDSILMPSERLDFLETSINIFFQSYPSPSQPPP